MHKVSDLELATRLSYFLWSSTPDEELLRVAEQHKLHEPAVLDAQVKRMLSDPHSNALVDNFVGQWLELRNLDSVKPDQDKFLSWGPELKKCDEDGDEALRRKYICARTGRCRRC